MSGEPNHLTLRDAAYWQSRTQYKSPPGPRPTLGDLHRATPWVWVYCEKCQHYSPLALAAPVIRWGANVSSDKLRQCARCTACGHKGATIQRPGWGGADVGFLPFPVKRSQG
jgi:hypothetical protein